MQRVEQIMGMPIVVEVRDGDVPEAVFDWFRWVDDTFSTYKPDSQVSRIARGELAVDQAHADVQAVLGRCEQLRAETNGYFDAYTGGTLDPSGLVKGWSVDRAAELIAADEYLISAGGDIRMRGEWSVGIQHPLERQAIAAVVNARDLAVATSGEYARGRHVIDPHTGAPPDGILSVTITGPDLATADAYATAAFAMGAGVAPHWVARLQGYGAMLILSDERVLSTPLFGCAAR
jgi:thiamine biosynthesis lipoprotein